jgi:hypothetical protein
MGRHAIAMRQARLRNLPITAERIKVAIEV